MKIRLALLCGLLSVHALADERPAFVCEIDQYSMIGDDGGSGYGDLNGLKLVISTSEEIDIYGRPLPVVHIKSPEQKLNLSIPEVFVSEDGAFKGYGGPVLDYLVRFNGTELAVTEILAWTQGANGEPVTLGVLSYMATCDAL